MVVHPRQPEPAVVFYSLIRLQITRVLIGIQAENCFSVQTDHTAQQINKAPQ